MTVEELMYTISDTRPVTLFIGNGICGEEMIAKSDAFLLYLADVAKDAEVVEISAEDGKLKVWCDVDP